MLTIDLAALSAAELRRLAETARARGQDGLAAQLTAELRARHTHRPDHRPPVAHYDEEPVRIRLQPEADGPQPRGGGGGRPLLMASAVVTITVALGWNLMAPSVGPPPPSSASAPRGMAVRIPAPSAPVATAPAPQTSARPAERPRPNPCFEKETPADRLVCGYPVLASQDREMQAAYERAVAAGADPEAVRHDQAAWKATRDRVSDWEELRDVYAARIGQLEATAMAAETLAPAT